MKYKSAMTTQASGSVDGMTASHNRFGRYMRARVIPVNPSTTRQTQIRQAFAEAVRQWTEDLTTSQRSSWETYASQTPVVDVLGDSVHLSGQMMWIRSSSPALFGNTVSGSTDFDPVADFAVAPATFDLGELGVLTFGTVTAGTQEFTVTVDAGPSWASDDDARLYIYVSGPTNSSVRFFKGPYRLAAIVPGDSVTPVTSEVVGLPGFSNPLISFLAGQRLHFAAAVMYPDGRYTGRFNLGSAPAGA